MVIFRDFFKFDLIIINGHLRYVEVSWGSREAISGHISHFRPLPAKWSAIMRIIKNQPKSRFWQKIQIFFEHTYIYQIYIKIHAMSICLSFILTPFPWTNLRAKYIYGILLTWWRYSDYFKGEQLSQIWMQTIDSFWHFSR